ncbi:VHS/GAT domain-containing protein [Cordyceps fumosorosea ARSEF 2679]|uniref:VHS/GAT domain-containing protein n=1 Tax=Cordyceps fumosorosea (strain ARSEF 2679) TaxID=1081104 RepID=A0A167SZG8_CORFA|nr:VHS/GAT domain-containing protein [Cordyceps fumosorosea ARSEF 2679]OAA60089.1 VHS/GAT domain-containing protein [Cordyceps fumosorosea ARSEF 2679]
MKSMKGLSMNKMLGSIKRKSSMPAPTATMASAVPQEGEAPEKTAHNSVKAFCESGYNVQGDEVLFLPPIVDAAESSPAAATECARLIRKFLSKEYFSRAAWQYNAIMLLRILTENPGSSFTRNIDGKFADTCKALLRGTKDLNVRQMLIETLDDFQQTKSYDENLSILLQMWSKERTKIQAVYGNTPRLAQRPFLSNSPQQQSPNNNPNHQNYFSRHHTNNKLPSAVELASRLEEARTSAKLLEQVVMNTPPAETLNNDLIKEFADRCLSASRSIQGYMVASNPGPDNETMESLIDTNEQLQTALSHHQRSVLSARKQLGLNVRSEETTPAAGTPVGEPVSPLLDSPALPVRNGKGKETGLYLAEPQGSGPALGLASGSGSGSTSSKGKQAQGNGSRDDEDPFADPFVDPQHHDDALNGGSRSRTPATHDDLPHEPFHPGFTPASVAPTGQHTFRDGGATAGSAAAKNASIDDLYEAAATTTTTGKGKYTV